MQIIKRNGEEVRFYTDKIVNAITKAMNETELGIDFDLALQIAHEIYEKYHKKNSSPTVEDVQDDVERLLAEYGRFDVAKRYIIYREERQQARQKGWDMTDLQRDILTKKYYYEGEDFNDWVERVGKGSSQIKKLIRLKKFLPAGRILMGRGLNEKGIKVSYSNCFTPGTKVLTSTGYRSIEDIKVGELVLTGDGTYQKVNATMEESFEGELVVFNKSFANNTIKATPNHKFKTQEGWKTAEEIWIHNNKGKKKQYRGIAPNPSYTFNYQTIKISQLLQELGRPYKEEGEYICTITPFQAKVYGQTYESYSRGGKMFSRVTLNDDVMYLLGRYLGDGSLTTRNNAPHSNPSIFQIVFNAETEQNDYIRCQKILEENFGVKVTDNSNSKQGTKVLKVCSEAFGILIESLVGAGVNKHFPINYENHIQVLIGLLDADGMIARSGKSASVRLVLANKHLFIEAVSSLRNNGFNVHRIVKDKIGYNKEYTAWRLQLTAEASKDLIRLMNKEYSDGRHLESEKTTGLVQLGKPSREFYKGAVYNLSVENNHEYFVEGVLVHNCFVISAPQDNLESIFDTAKKMARTYSYGGGCGTTLENLRPRGAIVRNAAKSTSGAVSFMDLYSLTTGLIGQNSRRGALMLSMPVTHPDIIEFVNVKTDLDKVTKANVSVMITDDFMKTEAKDEMWHMEFKVKDSGEVVKRKTMARELLKLIAKNNWRMAEPGALFWDRVEKWHLNSENPNFKYSSTNPCGEKPLPEGGSCLLGSLNLSEYVIDGKFDYKAFRQDVKYVTAYLDDVLTEGIPHLPLDEQKDSVTKYRQLGIGVMGLADALIKMGIRYGSGESLLVAENIAGVMINAALQESALRAGSLGTYPAYSKEHVLKSPFLQAVASPETLAMVEKYGLRNAELLSIAPTGSISTMIGVSGGIEPIFQISYTRKSETLNEDGDTYYEVFTPIAKEYMTKHNITKKEDLPSFFVTSATLDYRARVDMQSVWQYYVDSAISSTVNVPNNFTVDEVVDMYRYAWEKDLKGITLYRDGCERAGVLTTKDTKKNEGIDIDSLSIEDLEDLIYEKAQLAAVENPDVCPMCGGKMNHSGGCAECQECAYSPCAV